MAFTVHWANHTSERYLIRDETMDLPTYAVVPTSKRYRQKIGSITPALSVQGDVLYPNALASLSRQLQGSVPEGELGPGSSAAVGCKGNQFDNEFPYEPRVPVALPMIQYPTNTRGPKREEQDMCALPVLNWENYIKNFNGSCNTSLGMICPRRRIRKFPLQLEEKSSKIMATGTNGVTVPHCMDPALDELDPEVIDIDMPEGVKDKDSLDLDSEAESDKDQGHEVAKEMEAEVGAKQKQRKAMLKRSKWPNSKYNIPKPRWKWKPKGPKSNSIKEIKDIFLRNSNDLEREEKELEKRKRGRPKKYVPAVDNNYRKEKLNIRPIRILDRKILPLLTLRKYTMQPKLKVMGTWNYLYSGHGACDWAYDAKHKSWRNLYIANGDKLRMIGLKPSQKAQMLSYTVDSVWEEEEVPSNIRPERPEPNDALSDIIFQIKTDKRRNIIAVQRGRSIEIYEQEGPPALLTSIPNLCYGTNDYLGWKGQLVPNAKVNPLLLSFDLNPHFPAELVTIDENGIIQFLDFAANKVIQQVKAQRQILKLRCHGYYTEATYPEIRLNDGAGVAYAGGGHPEVIYQWLDSQVYLYDRRTDQTESTLTTELLNLRHSRTSFSWSDQQDFKNKCERILDEYISSLKPSKNPMYYYVGTDNRVFLMDMRVPKNPVAKFSHGMKSPAAYLDVLTEENYEVLVGGSQRSSETFCAIFDNAHVGCAERPECKQRNPVLQSYPRHIQNPREFFDYAQARGHGFGWEADHQRVKDHSDAWPTGLCLMKSPKSSNGRMPSNFLLFHGNSFGDAFVQEWEQKPIEVSRTVRDGDERLSSFMSQWRSSMSSKSLNEFLRPTPTPAENPYDPVDCSLLIESFTHALKHSNRLRSKPFDSFTPSVLTYNRVRDGLPPLRQQIDKLRSINSERVQNFLDVWIKDPRKDEDCSPIPSPSSAPHDQESQSQDGTYDFETHSANGALESRVDHALSEFARNNGNGSGEQIRLPESSLAHLDQIKEELNEELYNETADTDVEVLSEEEEEEESKSHLGLRITSDIYEDDEDEEFGAQGTAERMEIKDEPVETPDEYSNSNQGQ